MAGVNGAAGGAGRQGERGEAGHAGKNGQVGPAGAAGTAGTHVLEWYLSTRVVLKYSSDLTAARTDFPVATHCSTASRANS